MSTQRRVANGALFTGKINSAIKGFEAFAVEKGLQGQITAACQKKKKKKRQNLKQKYKDLKCPQAGVGTEDGESVHSSILEMVWCAMDEAKGSRPSITPPVLVASSGQDVALASSSSLSPAPARKITRKIEDLMKEIVEREAAEREERRWREMEEKEDRRERERQKEERRERESREREDRWRQETCEKEERRDREAKEREERFLRLLEILLKKIRPINYVTNASSGH
ncbi:ensconsin-like [Carassius auratus]|uniref:Ensconsin-like n=1 Tax=Carassius auratus TaxID=7957 RepID=A0A6P6P8A0_CARAU|nr:ensconsin-like [Carassius auratus]